MNCIICNKNKALVSATLGILPCHECSVNSATHIGLELIPDSMESDRRAHQKDVIQPYRDGVLSKEYIEQYGTQSLDVTQDEVNNASYVWDDNPYQFYKTHE